MKTTCFIADMEHFKEMNEVYATFFPGKYPARSTFAVKELPAKALIEMETIAMKPAQ